MISLKQKQALRDATKRINLFEGCVRSGKTFCANTLFLEQCYTIPYDKFLLTGKTKDTLKRNVTEDLIKTIGLNNCEYNAHMGELKFSVGKENRTIYCVGALDERAVGRIQGGTFGSWYADERVTHPEGFCEMARTRLSVPKSKAFWTCNPDSPYHPVYTDYILKKESRNDLFHLKFVIDDNPSLTPEYIQELKTTYSGIFFRRMILGEWLLAEGIIYDSFGIHHVVTEIPPVRRYWAAIDYGTASVTVFLLFAEGEDGRTYVLKEWFWDAESSQRQLTDPEILKSFQDFTKDYHLWRIFPDPSATSLISLLRKHGYQVTEAENDVLEGIRTVSSGFFNNDLLIHSGCKTTISEISDSYVWDERAKKRGEDKPLKKNDHRSDTLRYGYYSYKIHTNASTSVTQSSPKGNFLRKKDFPLENPEDFYIDSESSRFNWRHKRSLANNIWLKRKRVILR